MTEPSVSWKVYVDTKFDASEKAVGAALAAAEKAVSAALSAAKEAVTKAETASGARFDDANHIKEAMQNAQKDFARIDSVEALKERLGKMENRLSASDGQTQGVGKSFANINTVLILVLGAAAIAIPLWMRNP
jgi:hypothetical protein